MVKVGSMSRANRILMIAGVAVLSVNGASASWFRHKSAEKAPQQTAAPLASMMLNAIEIEPSSGRLLLRTSGTPVYTSYSPAPARFVVDLTATAKDASLTIPSTLPPTVSSISVDEVTEMGTRLTRVTVNLTQPATPQAVAADNLLAISLPAPMATHVADEALPAVVPVIPPSAQASAAPVSSEPEAQKVPDPVIVSEPIRAETTKSASATTAGGSKAKSLKSITTTTNAGQLEVSLNGDGELAYKAFKLENPTRVVLDLTGVKNKVTKTNVTTGDPNITRVRVSQFAPDITRVVLDLSQKGDYHVVADGSHLRVTVGAEMASAAPAPAPEPVRMAEATPVTAPPPVAPPVAAPAVAAPVTVTASKSTDITEHVPTVAETAMPTWKMPAKAVISAPAGQTAPPSTPASTKKKKGSTISKSLDGSAPAPASENVFSDPSAQQAPVLGSNPSPSGATSRLSGATPGQTAGGGRMLSQSEKVYTGEPIDLNLKDAEIKDVLRTFSNLTGLNIAVDPGVQGFVTVDFVGVPWDQALEIILKQNFLTYVLEGNVMRIGYTTRIADEQKKQSEILEQEKLNVPLTTVSRKLSYARASDVAALLREIQSPKAKIIVDTRTNQLIISEIPGYLSTMQNLVDAVDVATRQVVIEARIVETSKTFLQQYGFNWGFGGKLDPSLGTGTGLVFPNRVDFTGGPFNFGPGNPIISTHMSNILGTFTLDLALNAAEAEGLVKVISAPRVMTQDNVSANISSGFQIPYQTRINFTTTISYLDAVLNLTVTPQITEAGTVIMEIAVQKVEPATGLAIEGSAGTPLSTRSARTRLMVRDGGTSVIAGIYQTKENDSRTRMPFVHQIPIIGNLFKTHNINTSHDELLIFITPRIVRNI
jgi:type IV pilus assembly protein PilQ